MNKLQIFNNKDFGMVRTVEENGKVLFCGSDIAKALGYNNTRDALITHCSRDGVAFYDIIDSMNRRQKAKFITEGNVYRLIAHSKLPSAEKFEKWVFDEVLPSIRKTGGYVSNEDVFISTYLPFADENTKILFSNTLSMMRKQNEIIKNQNIKIQEQQQEITEMKPKVYYYDIVLQCKDLVLVSVIARDYGWTAKKMNDYLYGKGIQFKRRNTWLLYSKYANCGYVGTQTHIKMSEKGEKHSFVHTLWTQKGRLFIYNLLKADNILPLVERENT